MEGETKLTLIKSIHTAIWVFMNVVIFYMLYAATPYGYLAEHAHKLDRWLWTGYGFIVLEGLILLTFNSHCPLNLLAKPIGLKPRTNRQLIHVGSLI